MKLAFCLFKYFPHGGLQRDFTRIAEECIHRGHSVDVIAMHWEGPCDLPIKRVIIPCAGWQNYTRIGHFSEKVQDYFEQEMYDIKVGFNKMPGMDIYYAADTCYQAKARQKHSWLYRLLPRYRNLVAYEKAVFSTDSKTQILLIAKEQQKEFNRFYATPDSRFHLLPPGIAKDRIAPDNALDIRLAMRKEFNLTEDDFLVLMVGSGFKTKGLDRILIGIAALPAEVKARTTLFVIGKDNPRAFQKQAKRLGIQSQVKFLGGRDDVPQLLLSADLLLHPAYNENTGTVLLEAVAAGLPVLTTDVCGYADYINQSQAGIVLTSPFRQSQFNTVLVNMLLSPERLNWRLNGVAFAKNADIYSMPERAVDIIESLGK